MWSPSRMSNNVDDQIRSKGELRGDARADDRGCDDGLVPPPQAPCEKRTDLCADTCGGEGNG